MDNEATLLSETNIRKRDIRRDGLEYETVIKSWTRYFILWKKLYKELKRDPKYDPFKDLMELPM